MTAFEKALLLEAWFRDPNEFTYSIDIDPGHSARDLADWILDEDSPNYRTGYCEQFATAMAAMARSLSIPSRVVLGFTPGEVLADGRIVVRGKNAHAWVELWMNGQGWVRFDPTPRGDGINPSTNFNAVGVGFDARNFIPDPEDLIDPTDPGATGQPTNPDGPDFEDAPIPLGPDGLPLETSNAIRLTAFQIILAGLAALLGKHPVGQVGEAAPEVEEVGTRRHHRRLGGNRRPADGPRPPSDARSDPHGDRCVCSPLAHSSRQECERIRVRSGSAFAIRPDRTSRRVV